MVTTPAFAQDQEQSGFVDRVRAWQESWIESTDAWWIAEPVATFVSIQDTRMSPLVYSGLGAGLRFSDVVVRPAWSWSTDLLATYTYPRVPEELPGDYHAIGITGQTLFLRHLPAGFSVGGGIRGGTMVRLYSKLVNSSDNIDVLASLVAAGGWNRAFKLWGRSVEFATRLSAPVFSYVGRSPEYSLFGYSSHLAAPWRLVRINSVTGLTWLLKHGGGNTASLTYSWDFYAFDEFGGLHKIRIATHTLGLSVGLKRL